MGLPSPLRAARLTRLGKRSRLVRRYGRVLRQFRGGLKASGKELTSFMGRTNRSFVRVAPQSQNFHEVGAAIMHPIRQYQRARLLSKMKRLRG